VAAAQSRVRADLRPPIHQGPILACAFLGGPRRLATGSAEGAIVIWDTAARVPVTRWPAHVGPVTAVAWDGARSRLISGGYDRRIVANDPDGGAATPFARHDAGLFALAVSPDGEVLAAAGYDRVIRLWRLADGAPIATLEGHQRAVTSLDFLDDGRLASCGRDYQVIVWDLAARAVLVRTEGHARWAMGVRASADGRLLFSVGEDGAVCCWAADSGARTWRRRFAEPVWGLERTPAGDAIVVGRGGAVARLALGEDGPSDPRLLGRETARAMARSPGGLMALGADNATVLLYEPAIPDAPIRRLLTGAPLAASIAAVRAVSEPSDPPRFAAVITHFGGEVELDLAGEPRPLAPAHDGIAFASAVVDEATFATSGFDGKVHLRRVADGGHVGVLDHGGFVFSLNASKDGARLLVSGEDRLTLWDMRTKARLWLGEALGVGFHIWATLSDDGAFAFAVGEGQGLHRWSFADRSVVRTRVTLDCGRLIGTCGLMGVAILDHRSVAVATAAGEIRRAELATGRTELLHAVHERGPRALMLSPDRRRLLSFSENSVAAVYDLAAGRLATPAAMAGAPVPAAAFTPTGDLVWVDGAGAFHALTAEALDASA
jgi:WD40 repeat protein